MIETIQSVPDYLTVVNFLDSSKCDDDCEKIQLYCFESKDGNVLRMTIHGITFLVVLLLDQ